MTSEPDVTSPVAMDIDEDGRWFVVEMPGYPLDTSPSGRIKLLEDTNGDGRPDKSTVFADQLVLPTGVMRWKRGVLVTAAPDLLYLEDSDGDGKADKRTVMLTGFAVTNPQHSVNGPTYTLDNWIQLAYSGGGGALIFPELFGDRGKPLTFPGSPSRRGRGREEPVRAGPARSAARRAALERLAVRQHLRRVGPLLHVREQRSHPSRGRPRAVPGAEPAAARCPRRRIRSPITAAPRASFRSPPTRSTSC